jgi:hypothetical protein
LAQFVFVGRRRRQRRLHNSSTKMGFMDNIWRSKQAKNAVPLESTPLNVNATNAGDGTDYVVSAALEDGTDFLKKQASKLFQMCREGPLSFRILAFLGGIGMIFASLVHPIIHFSVPALLIAFYTFWFGVLICVIEGRVFDVPKSWQSTVKFYFRVLDFVGGRGVIWAFAGSLMLSQPSPINLACGYYMIFVGLVAIIASIDAGKKLAKLRLAIDSKRDLRRIFGTFDFDKDGALSEKEFASLCFDLGVDVTYNELTACFNAIDKNDNGVITFDEFRDWWTQWGVQQLNQGCPLFRIH